MKSYNLWSFVTGFFHSVSFSRFSHVEHVSVPRSCSLSNIIIKSFSHRDMPPVYPFIRGWTFGLSTLWLLWIKLLWTFTYKFSFLSSIHLGMGIAGQYGNSVLTFWRSARLFSKMAAPFHIPSSNVWRLQFLHILSNTCYYDSDYSYFLMCLWASVYLLWRCVYSDPLLF